ncbi:bifunctional oligoribonuclease/PAP phosphatase NrnA [soil metagenome]|nr:DHH family phosphoesterase [Trueperaceae bacterium]
MTSQRTITPEDADRTYRDGIARSAELIQAWTGPVVIVGHVDPDGDAIGSVVGLGRALRRLGKDVTLPIEAPRFLHFMADEGELSPPLTTLASGTLAIVLDSDLERSVGAPLDAAARTLNLDHHGTNPGDADLAVIAPHKAAAALMVKDLVDELGLAWDERLATPVLMGLVSDTGTFRFGNTDRDVLCAAGDLIATGLPYAELIDRLRWRHPDHYRMLAMVLATVRFDEGGAVVSVRQTAEMRERLGPTDDDSSDFVNVVRDAEGTLVAFFLREIDDGVKVSIRSRPGVSAQAICVALGGGGHVAAAGATLRGVDVDAAYARVMAATRLELARATPNVG